MALETPMVHAPYELLLLLLLLMWNVSIVIYNDNNKNDPLRNNILENSFM